MVVKNSFYEQYIIIFCPLFYFNKFDSLEFKLNSMEARNSALQIEGSSPFSFLFIFSFRWPFIKRKSQKHLEEQI